MKSIVERSSENFSRNSLGQRWQHGTALSQWLLASWGITKPEKFYVELVETLLTNYGKMGCRMFLKVRILDIHFDKSKNMGSVL